MNRSDWIRHCEKETIQPIYGEAKGEIPSWLEGNLVRNGPGVIKFGDTTYDHLFDGQSTLHKFNISGGKVTYQCKILQSDTYRKNKEKERIVVAEFGTVAYPDPCMSLFDRFKAQLSLFNTDLEFTDNCNINVAFYGDQLYALTEASFARRIDPHTLETIGDKTKIRLINTSTAHPHILPDGTMLNLGSNYKHKSGPLVCIYKVPVNYEKQESSFENFKLLATIPSRWKMNPAYYHSFGMSLKNIIFIESPLCVNIPRILTAKIMRRPFRETLVWYGKEKTRFHVLSIEDGKIHPIIYEGPAMFAFHHINAYEVDGQLIVDVAGYNDHKVLQSTTFDNITDREASVHGATPRRFVLPLYIPADAKIGDNLVKLPKSKATAKLRTNSPHTIVDITPQHLSEDWVELPRINYKLNGRKYNFIYGVTTDKSKVVATGFPAFDTIVKIDIGCGIETKYFAGNDSTISEPIFVSNPCGSREDEGILLATVLYNHIPNDVKLIVLNAENMKELASVKFTANGCCSLSFHGQFHADQARVQIN